MKKILCIVMAFFFFFATPAFAAENPLGTPNNKFGIHILFPTEIQKASELVNSTGGDWGYVTIPIQSGDKDLEKWQKFMDDCRKLHIIPLVRLATEGDYFNTKVWRKPKDADIVDFANFLNSLSWPTKNRYIIVFNEVNRADEWGGVANPSEYAHLLSFAVTVFKSKSPDFFIITSGMDNASATGNNTYNQYDYFQLMNQAVPGIFLQVDGLSSHSYPNPAFSQPPSSQGKTSIASFRHERSFIQSLGGRERIPIFITETGWSTQGVNEEKVASYMKETFESVWNDQDIVAVTPFLLKAGAGPFEQFSFLRPNDSTMPVFSEVQKISKTKGQPKIEDKVLGEKAIKKDPLPVKSFGKSDSFSNAIVIPLPLKIFFKLFLPL